MTTTTKRKKYVVSFLVAGQGRKFQVMSESGAAKLLRDLRKRGEKTLYVTDAPNSAKIGRVWWA
jgi:hypothetical protein